MSTATGRTSMRLEPELWDALVDICRREGTSLKELLHTIETAGHPGGRTSAVRVFIVTYLRRIHAAAAKAERADVAAQ